MKRRRERLITMCPKCNQIKVEGRMLVGSSWTICECDKPVDKVVNTVEKSKHVEPFVPKFE